MALWDLPGSAMVKRLNFPVDEGLTPRYNTPT